uniref:Uncharacterized protein n=1 Tax=Oryza barthii TaxID=65489 RepID=A0A0D3FX57_9ORYZ
MLPRIKPPFGHTILCTFLHADPIPATHGPGRRTPSRLRLLLCLIYQLGFRGVAIRVAEENGGAACAWPSSAGWLRTSSHCASSRWAHLPVREGGVQLACALHVSGGPRVRHHGFIAHPTKQPYPPTAPTRWLELNYERNCNPQSSHTTYLQAISVVTASKSSTVCVSVQGKSAADDLSYFKSTQTHTISYMKNKIPHIDVFLTEQDFKNNEIYRKN